MDAARHSIDMHCRDLSKYRNDFGLELRVEHGGELVESRLSRVGEAPLPLIADQYESKSDGERLDRDAERGLVTRRRPDLLHRGRCRRG